MKNLSAITLVLLLLAAAAAHAQGGIVSSGSSSVPEIDPAMVGGGLALLAGITVVLRSRRKP